MSEELYYVSTSGKSTGPYTLSQLRSMWGNGTLTAEAFFLIEKSSASEWHPISEIASLLEYSAPATFSKQTPSFLTEKIPERTVGKKSSKTPHIVEQMEIIRNIDGNTPISISAISKIIQEITEQKAWGGVVAITIIVILIQTCFSAHH